MRYYLVALSAYVIPFAFHWREIGYGDWDQAATWLQIAVWWWEQGDFTALWNPFLCGGYPLAGNPQLPLFHPSTLLSWAFGPAVGLKLMVLLWMTLGFWLSAAWWRSFGVGKSHDYLFAATWVLNGFFVGQLGVMHAHFVCFFLVPGFFLFIRRWVLEEKVRHLTALAALLALASVHSYGFLVYFFPFVPLYFVTELFVRRPDGRTALRLSVGFLVTVVLSLGVLAFYLVPALDYLRQYPRTQPPEFENPLKLVTYLFFPGKLFPSRYPAWEYQTFLGPVLFGFLVMALVRRRAVPRAFLPPLVCAAAAMLLAIGSFHVLGSPLPSPFDIVRAIVPGYGNARVTSRFLIGALPALLLLAHWRWVERGVTRLGIALVLLPLVGFQLNNGLTLGFKNSLPGEKKPAYAPADTFVQETVANSGMYALLSPTTGILGCYESTPLPGAAGAFPGGPLGAAVEGWGRLRVDVPSGRRDVTLAMNYHPGWRVVGDGAVTASADGRVVVTAPDASRRVELVFEDRSAGRGRRVSMLSAAALFLFLLSLRFYTGRVRRRRTTDAPRSVAG